MTKHFMMNKHNKLYHMNECDLSEVIVQRSNQTEITLESCHFHVDVALLCDEETQPSLSMVVDQAHDILLEKFHHVTYGNTVSSTFFDHDKRSVGGGSTYLVTQAITKTPLVVSHTILMK